jgi:glycosyltransferase involved in cell wall biosynthesis
MLSDPPVSVLMSVHNEASFLKEAVESILGQTFGSFEFICIDDGSTDGSGVLLDTFAKRDSRIRVVHQENMGQTMSLNLGLGLARGHVVARMDADDISEPTRIHEQLKYLEGHPRVAVFGTSQTVIDHTGKTITQQKRALDPLIVRWEMFYTCSVAHSSVMFRRGIVQAAGGYDSSFKYAQDYELWTRLLMSGAGISSSSQYLLKYRITGKNVFLTKRHEQENYASKAGHRYVEWLLQRNVPKEQVSQMRLILSGQRLLSQPLWRNVIGLCDELLFRAESECTLRQIRQLRWHLSDTVLTFARHNARPWPADSLRGLRWSISLLPRRALDTRSLGVMLVCSLRLLRRVKLSGRSAAQL